MKFSRFIPHFIFAVLTIFAVTWSAVAALLIPLPNGPDDFNSPGFIVRHSWVKFALLAERPFQGQLSRAQEDARVAQFFQLNAGIDDQERIGGDPATDPQVAAAARAKEASLRSQRADIENTVELILEGRLTHVIKESGLLRHVGGDIVWPPVNIDFQDPPSVLVTSPRSQIKTQSQSLLQGDLSIQRVQQLESNAESDGKTSALVVQIGGIAMYPAIIPPDSDYHYIMQDIAHEWMHHYLYFAPLGRAYFDNAQLTTLNETVANMVGRELGDQLFKEYPLTSTPSYVTIAPMSAPAPATAPPADIDFTKEMRDLRRQVEALLAQGKIDDAEQAMEQKREFLAANGYYIRRLNQAYFAFNGSYADSAGSIDPIGPKLDTLRHDSASLKAFVDTVRTFTSVADLDHALVLSQSR